MSVHRSLRHDSALKHVAGEAVYIDDMPEPPGTLHSFAENASATESAAILATYVADDNCGPLVIFEK